MIAPLYGQIDLKVKMDIFFHNFIAIFFHQKVTGSTFATLLICGLWGGQCNTLHLGGKMQEISMSSQCYMYTALHGMEKANVT